jgi:hypothetical protein
VAITEVWSAANRRCPQIGYVLKGETDQEKPYAPRDGGRSRRRIGWDNPELIPGGRQAQGEQLTLARNTKATKSALLIGHDA